MQERRAEQGVALAHERVRCEVAVADRGADAQTSVAGLLDRVRELRHVHEQRGRLDAEPHQVDEVRPTAEEARVGLVSEQRDRAGGVARALVGEWPHEATSRIAGTRFA